MPAPLQPVRARLRHLTIEERNGLATVDVGAGGEVLIACGGRTHRAAVGGGRFDLLDHDVESELALFVLGGTLPTCLVYAAVWGEAFDPASVFLAKWAEDLEGERVRAQAEDWRGNYWESWPSEPPAARVLFGPGVQEALALAVVRRWIADAGGDARQLPASRWMALQRAVQTRARRAFVASLAHVDAHRRPDALVPVAIEVGTNGATPRMAGRLAASDSRVTLTVRPEWLWTVWARGLGVVGGRFVLAAAEKSLEVVQWNPSGGPAGEHLPEVVTVRMGASALTP